MTMMSAYQLVEWQKPPRFAEVEIPRPSVGELLIRVAGAGLCQSDLHFMDAAAGTLPYPLPFTLGHEIGGWVEEVGDGVTSAKPGDAVALYTMEMCGLCWFCRRGHENYCQVARGGRGYGTDGGLAPFVIARDHQILLLKTLNPVLAAPLTDAGTTSIHAVKKVLPGLSPGSTAIVIGIGGLGGFAIQYLRELSPARIVAIDIKPDRLQRARDLGASDALLAQDATRENLLQLTERGGADAVLDFVGDDHSMEIAFSTTRRLGKAVIVGVGGGSASIKRGQLPFECEVCFTLAGSRADLADAITLAESGRISVDVDVFPLEDVAEAYDCLRAGSLGGRAVVTPKL